MHLTVDPAVRYEVVVGIAAARVTTGFAPEGEQRD